jgi:hypothetical protein
MLANSHPYVEIYRHAHEILKDYDPANDALHYVSSMSAVFALFAGFYYWTPKIVGRNTIRKLIYNII